MGSPHDIKCPTDIKKKIIKQLDPPYEDLFDQAEQMVLNVLLEPWDSLVVTENLAYENVGDLCNLNIIALNFYSS